MLEYTFDFLNERIFFTFEAHLSENPGLKLKVNFSCSTIKDLGFRDLP